ncbi:MAG: DUF2156 domain-containing protein, partial [Clostridia bacterium]|nr:DUF2156 domain-containing protein [Clostridia bacterium]
MINFKKLEKNDIECINKYLLLDKTRSCEKTAGALMMWRDFYKIKWAIYDETLIIKYDENPVSYLFPIGKNIKGVIDKIGSAIYIGVCGDNLSAFEAYNVEIMPLRDNFDYIYDAESLRTFQGKRLHSKRNFLNRFKATYQYEFIFDGEKTDIIEFFKEIDKKQPHLDETGIVELDETIDMVENRELFCLHTGEIRVNGKIISACVGAQIDDTLYVHIEKADKDYVGSYQAIVSEFAKAFPSAQFIWTVTMLNRASWIWPRKMLP